MAQSDLERPRVIPSDTKWLRVVQSQNYEQRVACWKATGKWRNGSIIAVTVHKGASCSFAHSLLIYAGLQSFIIIMSQKLTIAVFRAIAQAVGQSVGHAITQELMSHAKGLLDTVRMQSAMKVWKKRRLGRCSPVDTTTSKAFSPHEPVRSRL